MKLRKKIKIFLPIALILSLLLLFYSKCVTPVIILVCEENAQIYTNNIINQTASELLSSSKYQNLIEINENAAAGTEFISTNTSLINEIALQLSLSTQERMRERSKMDVSIPLGALSGIVFLSNAGPDIQFSMIPSGSVAYEYSANVKTSGINQVHYQIILRMKTTVNLIIPGNTKQIFIDSEVMLADCIIAGKIPNVFLNTTTTYDLLP